jgi:hypothetical protein
VLCLPVLGGVVEKVECDVLGGAALQVLMLSVWREKVCSCTQACGSGGCAGRMQHNAIVLRKPVVCSAVSLAV